MEKIDTEQRNWKIGLNFQTIQPFNPPVTAWVLLLLFYGNAETDKIW